MKKAQQTIEALVIAIIAISIIGILFYSLQGSRSGVSATLNTKAGQLALDDLSSAGTNVYQQGIGSRASVNVNFPSDVASVTFLGNRARITYNSGKVDDRSLSYSAYGTINNPSEGEQQVYVLSTSSGVCFGDLSTCSNCGDGAVSGTESCDDGNTISYDGCSSSCQSEITPGTCGDGIVNQANETCDDGNLDNGDGCSSVCITEPICGDNSINQLNETCDDGNTYNGDGCNSICVIEVAETVCGDGSLNQANETCDDGNTVPLDGCAANCTIEIVLPVCGDGIVNQVSEECDDANLENYDGCSDTCFIENDTSSITMCLVITDSRGNITIASNRPNVNITINNSMPGHTTGGDPTAELPNTTYITPITLNADLFGNDSIKDGSCNTYYGLLIGNYYYNNVMFSGGNWQQSLYNDQYSQVAINTSYFYPYDYSVFDYNYANDGPRNRNSDGEIILVQNRSRRTLIVLVRYPYQCGDGIINQANETCDDGNTNPADGCSAICKSEVCGNNYKDWNETCDGTDFGGLSCSSYGFLGGGLSCTNCQTISNTSCNNVQSRCLDIDYQDSYLASSDRILRGVSVQNVCSGNISIIGANSTWSGSSQLKMVNITGNYRWSSTCTWNCTPSGQQTSGKRVYWKIGNQTPYILTPGATLNIERFEWTGDMGNINMKVAFILGDGTQNSTPTFNNN